MIKPMVVDLEVDATLGDGVLLKFFEKSCKLVWDLRTLAHFEESETSPDGIRA